MATTPRKSDEKPAEQEQAAELPKSTDPRNRVMTTDPVITQDEVAMVTRNADGTPRQTANYKIIVPDEDKERAENRLEDNNS